MEISGQYDPFDNQDKDEDDDKDQGTFAVFLIGGASACFLVSTCD